MLSVVATPIGNLSDITYRAVETLKSCDYILCEDTRHSKILLDHYNISKPLHSFHKFSESSKQDKILDDLNSGMHIGLISDAGTPGISDPGTKLIQACIHNHIRVSPIPGPCAAIAALSCSGLATELFQFTGFLPRKTGELKRALQEILAFKGTTVCYESPQRVLDVLRCLHEMAPARVVVIARELTKKFEQFISGTAQELLQHWDGKEMKGEIVLLFEGNPKADATDWSALSPAEHVALLQEEYGLTKQEAVVQAAKIRGVSKRDIYNVVHKRSLEDQ